MKKRFISMLCAFSLALLLAVPISAANHSPIVQDEILAINAVASDFDFESASPNPGYVDKTSLWIGEKIPTFEVQNNSLYPLSISFYPILNENGVIVAHAMTSTIEGFSMAGISCQLVSSLNDFAKENSNPEFALIYDTLGATTKSFFWLKMIFRLALKPDHILKMFQLPTILILS